MISVLQTAAVSDLFLFLYICISTAQNKNDIYMCSLHAEFDELGPSIDKLKLPIPRPTSTEYGAHVSRLPSRQSQRGDRNQPLSELTTLYNSCFSCHLFKWCQKWLDMTQSARGYFTFCFITRIITEFNSAI